MNNQDLSIEQLIALNALKGASKPAVKDDAFVNYTMYTPDSEGTDTYIGNYSMPTNFSEVTKANIAKLFESKGIRLQAPGTATKRDVTF